MNWAFLERANATRHLNPIGRMRFYDVIVEGRRLEKGCMRFEGLKRPYCDLEGFVCFWKGVCVDADRVAREGGEGSDEGIEVLGDAGEL